MDHHPADFDDPEKAQVYMMYEMARKLEMIESHLDTLALLQDKAGNYR